jgi:hypothetical protein
MVHRWSEDDDLIGYCLYRFGPDVFGRSVEEIAGVPGMPFSSLNIKIANFKFIAGNGGLDLTMLLVASHTTVGLHVVLTAAQQHPSVLPRLLGHRRS